MKYTTPIAIAALILLFGVSSALSAQQPNELTLDEILRRLEANLKHFDNDVPSFFCDEHVISQVESDLLDRNTIDSIFRLRRTPNTDHTTTLVESRDIQSVNGMPPTRQAMDGPSLLSGWFEGGLAVVSPNQTGCMNYELQQINGKSPNQPYIVRFSTVRRAQNPASCLLQEKSTGRVIIDSTSMQITRLEITTPRHTVIPGNSYIRPVVGERVLSIDYGPVALGGETFWMPSTITMYITSNKRSFHMVIWSFQATYRNYHEMKVTYRILPGSESPLR